MSRTLRREELFEPSERSVFDIVSSQQKMKKKHIKGPPLEPVLLQGSGEECTK